MPVLTPNVQIHPLYANVYLLSSAAGRLLVDAGAWPFAARFDRLLRDFAPDAVLLTHAHVDHVGGAYQAARRGIPLLAHPLEHPQITGEAHDLPYPAGRPEIGRLVSRVHPKVPADALHAVSPGETVLGWEVVHLPGHTLGQIGVLMDGVLVAADSVIGATDGAHLPKAVYNADHSEAKKTLKRMAEMELRAILPGHGRPLTPEQVRKRAGRREG
ncbi:MBL fold metallo-hydrolase [Deinococcus arenicola]|uniref:MBL fold metallo-hydrolase n=1 Tax=Deinococcus arenicola TaxID=2994950 RepID=A0ABU4DNH3_9DEIO|nr:MBL fold metallo-hydrolase [Deinococcus sp. ZS9-10]MDV6373986.1 MBL fold metallo-hydrolase [Deinococcus sp. ZS9-10]